MKKLYMWFIALNNPYCCFWRVTYPDGKRTTPLPYAEAKGLKDVFGGKLRIDYETISKIF